jgi:hypothetical protein
MGRRAILLLVAMATMVVVSAGVALAAEVIGTGLADNCATLPQPATTSDDEIALAGGDDFCQALAGNDWVAGDSDNDTLNGNQGTDEVYGNQGTDDVRGGFGADRVFGGAGLNDDANGGASDGDFVSVVDGEDDDIAYGGTGLNDICAVDDPVEADIAPDPEACEIVRVAD